ncbi:DUF1097 domain-containing protein [Clostridium magnum]|uniref:Inner membrane protein YcdZ n=1 Tax=Clostridium magnum DSM 2767 TaxID=1121326 RepID=A0A161WUU4_9CLOT|nr:DUF1097 domain-containing protein [Clostridium magnum]KZL90658.1 inner membrane protein YcdZ [Clostridium magnum DSM 2767]SHI38867.1 Protein of unknown function [Clostridium magnum DSM 2767]
MDFIIAIGISIGVLAGVWTFASAVLALCTFAGFLSWATFFACGGKLNGLKTTLTSNLSGVFWGFIIVKIAGVLTPMVGGNVGLAIGVAIGAAAMCWQAKISWLGFIPGAFVGCATYFATSANIKTAVIGLICGAVFGYLSELGGLGLQKKEILNDTASAS